MTTALVGKSHDIGRQVSKLPPWVVSIQSEIENFPYQRLKKASNTTALEAASHIGSGCTGAAFNVLSGNDEPLDEFEPMVARLQKARPFYDLMAKHLGRAEPVGLFTAWNKESALAGAMFSGAGFWGESSQVFEIGLPTAYGPNGAAVTLLFPSSLATMSKEEITKTLATGVYTDVPTLHALNQMGFQELTGLAIDGTLPIDCIEELTDHPLNAPFAGRQRDCRQSFNHAPGFSLKKVDPKAQTLARLVDYGGKEKAATSMAVFENRLGGRICVAGYFPWSFLHSLSKSAQMKSVSRWLSRDRLPAYVGSYHKVNLWARQPGDGRLAVALVNSSFDPADALSLVLRTESDQATVYDMEGKAQVIRADGRDGPYRRFTLPHVEPWSARLVTVDPPQPPKAASETTTNGVRVLRDLAYIGDGHERHQLDLCLPAKSEKPAPIVVWVHGGAWKMGSKEGCPAAWLVTKGYAVASINYRLSQHAIFPAQIQDCKAAIRWLRANAAKYALDAKHVGVWGASAGGHLVALLGTTSNVKAFEGDGGNLDQSSRVQAVIDWFGPSDFVALGAHERKIEQPLSTLLGGLVSENADKARLASPLTHVDKNAAPFLIVHGDKDDIVPLSHSQRLAAALQAAGVDVRLQVLSGSGHGGPAFLSPENVKVIEEFLDKHLK
jgi:acetyl esterase/lipase